MANEKRNLIDRDELVDSLGISDMEIFAKEVIGDAPLVDAVEVKHGRWEWYEALVNPYALCSNCGCGLDKRDALNFVYCPYCGAKLDGDGNGNK